MSGRKIVVLGAGKVGRLVTWFLAHDGSHEVVAADLSAEGARAATLDAAGKPLPGAHPAVADLADERAVGRLLAGAAYALSCAPFHCNVGIARAAREHGCHYMDLTEDVGTTQQVAALAREASTAFIPQCGLAPGFISIVAHDLAQRFERVDTIRMRVGALPLYPHNRLNYNVTWSTEGLVNEYLKPCTAVRGGQLVERPPLEDLEPITIDGLLYEAFNTSGGVGSMTETYAGRVREMDYKTIRYPGHRDVLKILIEDLRLGDDPALLGRILERALHRTEQDVVLVVVTVTGTRGGQACQESYVKKIYSQQLGGRTWGAIQVTTAAGLCAVFDLHAAGKLPRAGFVKQEQVALADFLENRFGRYYA